VIGHDLENLEMRCMEKFARLFCKQPLFPAEFSLTADRFKGIYALKHQEFKSMKMDSCP